MQYTEMKSYDNLFVLRLQLERNKIEGLNMLSETLNIGKQYVLVSYLFMFMS